MTAQPSSPERLTKSFRARRIVEDSATYPGHFVPSYTTAWSYRTEQNVQPLEPRRDECNAAMKFFVRRSSFPSLALPRSGSEGVSHPFDDAVEQDP